MKKILALTIAVFNLKSLCALPVGNPSEASLFFADIPSRWNCQNFFSFEAVSLGVGFYGDYVFNRSLETASEEKIDYSRMYTNAGYFVLNFWEAFDIFTTLGVTKFTFNTSLGPFNSTNRGPRFDFESSTAFSWSVGARGTIFEYQHFSLGVEGQYFSSCPNAKALFVRANVDAYPGEGSERKYSEWQIGAGISYRYNYYFVPYMALKYSHACWRFDDQTFLVTNTQATIPTLRNRKNIGFAIGATLAPLTCEKIMVTVEGRFADEAALYVNGQMRF